MASDERDIEIEWLNARAELSSRAVGRILGVHHDVVGRSRRTGRIGDALRRRIRQHIDEHGDDDQSEAGEQRGSDGDNGNRQASDEGRQPSVRRHHGRGRRGGRRGASDDGADGEAAHNDDASVEDGTEVNRESVLRLMYEIVGCRDVRQLAVITDRIRERCGVDESDPPIEPEPFQKEPTLEEIKAHALSLLSETPVVRELSLGAAVSAARAAIRGEVSLLDPPPLLYGDAVLLLAMRADASYRDAGAREVAFAPAGRFYACGLRAEELRDGITIEERMRRCYRDEHRDRPRLIGLRFSDVIPERPYPDEDFFFGSDGWTDADGEWRPGRAELIARWRHVGSLCEDWQADRPTTLWQYALSSEKAELELTLLTPEYAMTFDRGILGDARWPTSTRLGHETQARLLLLRGNDQATGRLRRHRMRSRLLLWLPRILLRGIDRLLRAPPPALDGSVCGKRVWKPTESPMTPDYTTPNPVSGYVPSRAFRLRFRRHEFEPGWAPPPPDAAPPGHLAGALKRLAAGIRSATGRTGNSH